jgi:hypothetical protein
MENTGRCSLDWDIRTTGRYDRVWTVPWRLLELISGVGMASAKISGSFAMRSIISGFNMPAG